MLLVASHSSRRFCKWFQNSFKDEEYSLECVKYTKWFLLHLCPLYPGGIFFASSNYYLSNSISSVLFYLNDKLCVFKLSCGRYFCEDQVACVHLFKFPDSRVESSKLFKYPPNETRFLSNKNGRVNVLLMYYLSAVGYLLRLSTCPHALWLNHTAMLTTLFIVVSTSMYSFSEATPIVHSSGNQRKIDWQP